MTRKSSSQLQSKLQKSSIGKQGSGGSRQGIQHQSQTSAAAANNRMSGSAFQGGGVSMLQTQ